MERVKVPGRLRSSAPHMGSVRMNDVIRQRHLRDGFLKAQGTSTFDIVNPDCQIRRDKVKKSFACTQDSIPDDLRFLEIFT